jgi:hypothetical protein
MLGVALKLGEGAAFAVGCFRWPQRVGDQASTAG